MDYASRNGLVIFTHDLDFGALLANRKASQPSVIQVRAHAINTSRPYLEAGALVTVDPRRNRIRLLPI
jgi:predicted nuclease of predicted toxin-antitoxin system